MKDNFLDFDNLYTSETTDMRTMFSNCNSLTTLDLSSFDTSNVTDMTSMFLNMYAITTIYVSDRWDASGVTESSTMFKNCTNLPNYVSSVVDKTNAHTGSGGYLTYKEYAG